MFGKDNKLEENGARRLHFYFSDILQIAHAPAELMI